MINKGIFLFFSLCFIVVNSSVSQDVDWLGKYYKCKKHEKCLGFLYNELNDKGMSPEISFELGWTYGELGVQDSSLKYNLLCTNIDSDNEYYDAWFNLGIDYSNAEKWDLASQCFAKYLEYEPLNPEALLEYAYSKECFARYDEAIVAYKELLTYDANNALCGLAACYYRKGELDTAKYFVDKFINLAPKSASTYAILGDLYSGISWDHRLAIDYYSQALKMGYKDKVELYFEIGWSYSYLEKYNDAIAFFDKCLKKDKNEYYALMKKSYCLFELGDTIAAKQILHQTKNFVGYEADSYEGLTYFESMFGNYELAEEHALKSISYDTTSFRLDALGYTYLYLHDYERSAEFFQKSIELDRYVDAYLGMAIISSIRNQNEAAQKFINEAIQVDFRLTKGFAGFAEFKRKAGLYFRDEEETIILKLLDAVL